MSASNGVREPNELLALAATLADQAKPGEQIEVAVSAVASTAVRVYDGELESLTQAESESVGIRVITDGRQGFAAAGSLDLDVLNQMLAEARDNATFAEVDPDAGIAVADGVEAVDIDLWVEDLFAWSIQDKIEAALAIERRVRAADPRITGVRTAAYGDSAGAIALASSAGIRSASRATSASLGVQALASDGEQTHAGFAGDGARSPDRLDADGVVERATTHALDLLGSQKPASQRLSLVLDPRRAATMLGVVGGALSGERVIKGRTPFAGRVGEQIASALLTFEDNPTDPESLGAESHDGEGLACRRVPLVTEGRLDGFVWDAYTGRRSGTGSTGSAQRSTRGLPSPGIHALSVAAGQGGSVDDLIAGVDNGLFVFGLAGLHSGVNPVSGDVSLGVEGRMIRDGVLAEPVNEATISSTLQRLLLDIRAVGSDRVHLPSGVSTPSIVIGDVSLSGSS